MDKKMTRIEKIVSNIFPVICRDLEDFGFDSNQARAEMAKALKKYGAEDGAEEGLKMAQAIIDRGNALLLKEWKGLVEDALKRARVQLKLAIKNGVSTEIVETCDETLSDIEFSFAPAAEGEPAPKAVDVIRGLKRSLEIANRVGFALKGENDKVATQVAAAKTEEALRQREKDRAELVKGLLASIQE